MLNTVRHLRELGIEVRFEKERINSLSEDGEIMLTLLASFSQEESRSISENVKWSIKKRFEQGIPNSFCIYGYRWDGEKFVVVPEEAKIVRLIYDNFLHGMSAEQTEKQLAETGVKSYTGQHFSNMSIRAILKNEKYTGNMLLQKEYTPSHIDHKTKKNNGKLPQYWVADSHEAIIPLETFQAVQEEIKRRRELGALANPHIPTSCFTSKLKCAQCGKSYRRHQYKRVNDTAANWECRNKGKCDAKSIPEPALKEACRQVLELEEFDESIFLARVETITVHQDNLLIFHMKDGNEISHSWEFKSTARKDWWTKEQRDRMSAYQKKNPSPKKGTSCLTGHIRCEKCGENFHRQMYKRASGEKDARWFCSSHCGIGGIFEDTVQDICAKAMGLSEFDADAFREQIDHVGIVVKGQLSIYFKDGRIYNGTWSTKKRMPPLSEEHKRCIGEASRKYWRERRCRQET
ncbi:MAG: recombinase family protein [Selenomonadaceae bacterium]|nr:recombinase family protein [Selenomonadaceae bacterium]